MLNKKCTVKFEVIDEHLPASAIMNAIDQCQCKKHLKYKKYLAKRPRPSDLLITALNGDIDKAQDFVDKAYITMQKHALKQIKNMFDFFKK